MRFIFISILLLNYVYADLQSKITLKAQTACFLKNPTNGLGATDYSPVVTGQTLRQSIESSHTSTQSQATCDSWLLDPYVNVDTETYQVIANMDCSVNQEIVDNCDSSNPCPVTYYWTVINQYALSVDCQSSCEVPRDSDGNIYDFTPYISETDCTVPNLQQLVLAEDPNSLYMIVDAQYLNCEVNSGLTGCFYKKTINFDGNTDSNSTDNNATENNATLDNADLAGTNQRLDDIGTKLDSNGEKIESLGTNIDDVGTKIDSNGEKIDNLGVKLDSTGVKIDGVSDSVVSTGNYLGGKLDNMNDSITNELKFQGDRLHDDLNDLKALQSQPTDTNGSSVFDDSGIIDAIHQNTDAIKELGNSDDNISDENSSDEIPLEKSDIEEVFSQANNLINDLKTSVDEIQDSLNPNVQFNLPHHNTCVYNFSIMNQSVPIDLCEKVSFLRPYIVLILTYFFLYLLFRLHLFFIIRLNIH